MAKGATGISRLAVAFAFARRKWQQPLTSPLGGVLNFSTCAGGGERGRIIFLGTPQVAALVLQELLQAAAAPDSNFEVAAVVSRPSGRQWLEKERERQARAAAMTATAAVAVAGGAVGTSTAQTTSAVNSGQKFPTQMASLDSQILQQHNQKQQARLPNWSRHGPSAVEQLARSRGVAANSILCPVSAKEAFLDIPKYGTLNIHPSLLPRYRGPAPVTRALQDGCSVSGVSLVFTVLQCDAGPILEQTQVPIDPDIQAPELTEHMFKLGTQMLLRQLPRLLSEAVTMRDAVPQDEALASYAHKVGKLDGLLDFRQSAQNCHDLVRAMAGWPGSRASLLVENKTTGSLEPIEVSVLRTRVVATLPLPSGHAGPKPAAISTTSIPGSTAAANTMSISSKLSGQLPAGTRGQLMYTSTGELFVPCGDGNMLSILEVRWGYWRDVGHLVKSYGGKLHLGTVEGSTVAGYVCGADGTKMRVLIPFPWHNDKRMSQERRPFRRSLQCERFHILRDMSFVLPLPYPNCLTTPFSRVPIPHRPLIRGHGFNPASLP
ncbi:hypothetical protein VaNZ11_005032, partial [Volvox africanus]